MAKSIQRPHPLLFELQHLVSDLSKIERHHTRYESNTKENDIEHSFTVAMLCWFIITHHDLALDQGLTLKYALVHDFVERYAGDVNTFANPKERQEKIHKERVALDRLSTEFSAFPDLVKTMQDYETKSGAEAQFVWTVDKMQTLILGDMDNWRPYKQLSINYKAFCDKHVELLELASPHAQEIFESLIEYCKTTYYDRPKSSQQR